MRALLIALFLTLGFSQDVINPFHQPNIIYDQLNCYGGGDYDGSGIGQGDYDAALAGVNDKKLDVNGDQVVNATDAQLIQEYINGTRGYLPSHWNFLQTIGERESWLQKMLAIDKTDEKEWIAGQFISREFAELLHTNFHGGNYAIPPNLIPLTNGLFNMPLYYAGIEYPGSAHGMNFILKGDNPKIFEHWCGVESQTDQINIQPGSQSIPYNSKVKIWKITGYGDYNGSYYPAKGEKLLEFDIDDFGNASVVESEVNPNLLLTRPTVGIEDEKNYEEIRKSILKKIYPNPTNSQANISFTLAHDDNISIEIFDINGRIVQSINLGIKEQGNHKVSWNAHSVSSGIYHVILRNEQQVFDTRKVAIIK